MPAVECSICCYERDELETQFIDGSAICAHCIRLSIVPLFEKALDDEGQYPPRWGSVELYLHDFSKYFNADFITRYKRRLYEYKTKPPKRIYCKHKAVAETLPPSGGRAPPGTLLALNDDQIQLHRQRGSLVIECGAMVTQFRPTPVSLPCYRCRGATCAHCGTALGGESDYTFDHHPCRKHDFQDGEEPLRGLQRGSQWQRCPNPSCPNIVSLLEGCNHMVCQRCLTNFCYICGAPAGHSSGHWNLGNPCPRYNQPLTAVAQYDVDGDGEDDEDFEPDWEEAQQADDPADDEAIEEDDPEMVALQAAADLVDQAGIVVERGQAHIAAGNVMTWPVFLALVDEFTPGGFFGNRDLPIQLAWNQYVTLQQIFQGNPELLLCHVEYDRHIRAHQEVVHPWTREGFALFVREILRALNLWADMQTNGQEEPPDGAAWLHDFITTQMRTRNIVQVWPPPAHRDELPVLSGLIAEWLDSIPGWVGRAITARHIAAAAQAPAAAPTDGPPRGPAT